MEYTVHGILQARILEWIAYRFSRGSFQPRIQTGVSCIAGRFFTNWAIREVHRKFKKRMNGNFLVNWSIALQNTKKYISEKKYVSAWAIAVYIKAVVLLIIADLTYSETCKPRNNYVCFLVVLWARNLDRACWRWLVSAALYLGQQLHRLWET